MSRIVVVTFDLDNTLWDVDEVIRNAERVTRQWFDARVPELYATLTADDFMDIRKGIVAEHPELAHNLSKIRETVFERAIVAVGRAPAEATALAREAFELFLAERHKVSFYDAALDVLERLSKHHVLGALTNGNADIARLGLSPYFRFAFSAADVGAAKPAPHMFRAALAHTAAQPHQMIHIGDNPVDDIDGAAQLGIPTIWVNLDRRSDEAPAATRIVHRLHDIPRAIAEIESAQ